MKPVVSVIVLIYRGTDNARACLAALREQECAVPFEVLVCFNSTDVQDVEDLLPSIAWTRTLYSPVNLGFSGGNNFAAREALGDYIVTLNDDAIPEKTWLQSLVDAIRAESSAGAVGSRILFPDGRLQEAGGIIWSDGTTAPAGRGLPQNWPCFMDRRPVKYSSANGLIIPRTVWQKIDGFDESYYPAYYEDVDLCLAIRHTLGLEVLYEPTAVLRHKEAQSTVSAFRQFLFARNVQRIRDKWHKDLKKYPKPDPASSVARKCAAFDFRSTRQSVLVIDDRLPDSGLGSGFGRLEELLIDLHDKPIDVAFYPRVNARNNVDAAHATFVSVVDKPLTEHLEHDGVKYDVIIVSRPHNYQFFAAAIRKLQPQAKLIYDAEALFHRRLRMQAALEPDVLEHRVKADEMEQLEQEIAQKCDRVVCISVDEERTLREISNHCPIDLMSPLASSVVAGPATTDSRAAIVFVAGWLAGSLSPNIPALEWFAKEVLPHMRRALPQAIVRVSGKNPPDTVRGVAEKHGIELVGFVEDLAAFYGSARVAIAPITYGAGVKIKTIEAMQYGVPVVATEVGAEGLDLFDGQGIDITDNPVEFANRLVALLTDDALWIRRRRALDSIVTSLMARRTRWHHILDRALTNQSRASTVSPAPFA